MQAFIDLEAARLSRERAKHDQTDRFYEEQQHIAAQWGLGEPKPMRLITGELPMVDVRQIRLDTD